MCFLDCGRVAGRPVERAARSQRDNWFVNPPAPSAGPGRGPRQAQGAARRQAMGGEGAASDDGLSARRALRDRPRNRPRRHGCGVSCRRYQAVASGGAEARADGLRPRGARILEAERLGANLQERLAESCGLAPRVFEQVSSRHATSSRWSTSTARTYPTSLRAVRWSLLKRRGSPPSLCRFLDTAHQFKTTIDGGEGVSLVHGDLKPRTSALGKPRDQSPRFRHRQGAVAQPQGDAERLRQHAVLSPSVSIRPRSTRMRTCGRSASFCTSC